MDRPYREPPDPYAASILDSEKERVSAEQPAPGWRPWLVFCSLLAATLFTTFLAGGVLFAVSLLGILGAHEFGHYWASRRNRVNATLPFFIPAPPIFIAGTFGAFIQIKDPIPNRRVLMEIGAAGPIAGFIVAVPTLIIGLSLSRVAPAGDFSGMTFGSSLLLELFSKIILGVGVSSTEFNIELHPVAFAGWIGLLVTAFNLLPIGQLDGGHIIYAMFGDKCGAVSKLFFVLLFPLGYVWNGWWLWALIITLFGFKHAPVIDDSIILAKKHRIMGLFSIAIFVVTFIPVPFEFLS